MTREEQHRWLDSQMLRDHRFADTEFTIRRRAVEAVDSVMRSGRVDTFVTFPSGNHELAWREVRIYKNDIMMLGGLEQILLVEEILRRAMSDGGPGS